jgi:hypothetical protein
MTQGKYVELSATQRTEVWRRWKAGESLHTIGRAYARPHTSIHCLLAHQGGIVPAVRRRALLAGWLPVHPCVLSPKDWRAPRRR